jgi:hypothetical protein
MILSFVIPRTRGPGLIAPARPAQGATPGQLTLDDWVEMLDAKPAVPETPHGEAAKGRPASAGGATKNGAELPSTYRAEAAVRGAGLHHPVATELLETPQALLTRTHLRELGLERRAVDAVFRALPVVAFPGYSRPMIRVQDYLELVDHHTFREDRVRPIGRTS